MASERTQNPTARGNHHLGNRTAIIRRGAQPRRSRPRASKIERALKRVAASDNLTKKGRQVIATKEYKIERVVTYREHAVAAVEGPDEAARIAAINNKQFKRYLLLKFDEISQEEINIEKVKYGQE